MGILSGAVAIVLTLIVAPIVGLVILFFWFPHLLVKYGMRYQAYRSGMRVKYVGNENRVFCYGEKNRPQPGKISIVYVHGFTASKDQWISCFQQLPHDIHMIAVDLPGHGGSTKLASEKEEELSFDFAVSILDEFFDLVGLNGSRIHLVGSSLGGAIAGLYAAKFPDKIDRVTLACPAVLTPIDTDLQLQVKRLSDMPPDEVTYEHCLLLPQDVDGLREMFMGICFHKNIMGDLHRQIIQGILSLRMPKLPYYLTLFKSLATVNKLDTLEKEAHKITVPTQIIWGEDDSVIHVSGAEVLRSKLSNCRRVDIIDRCGHGIHLDRPGSLASKLLTFYKEGEEKKES